MIATLCVERLVGEFDWQVDGVIEITVPFARTKYNFVLELVATLTEYLQKNKSPNGIYRIGNDDTARISWDGNRPGVLTDIKPSTSEKGEAIQAILDANRERN